MTKLEWLVQKKTIGPAKSVDLFKLRVHDVQGVVRFSALQSASRI